ncbi:MAG TPA: nucleotidyltransferase domain-containing protein [Thermoanaerobaculia bacterium]|nr:nucleotidyltransferase domain-containing protein [Thermoanaerobaculia bacterium]
MGRTADGQQRSSLASAILTRTQQRVLGLFFGNPGCAFIKQELIDRTGSGSGAVQRELARLVESGLVTVTRIGSQKHYQANGDAPIFAEIKGIITKTVGVVDPLRAALRPLQPSIELALVYGSVARGDERANSDIDLLVVGRNLTLEKLFEHLAPAETTLGRKIHPTLYTPQDLARRRKNGNAFVRKVLTGQHLLLIGNEDAAHEPG